MMTYNDENLVYDENGNLIQKGDAVYEWNVRGSLISITSPNLKAYFKYDALGRRIEKTIHGKTINYLYDGLDIIQEIENGMVTVNYIRTLNIDEPLVRIESNGTIRYYQQDALGSVVALTDEAGTIKTQYVYDPYGNTEVMGEPSDNPFQYTGREYNPETGLYYYRARYYSPELQRFISEDPVGLGEENLYSYVKNSPLNWTDPLGLFEVTPSMESTWVNYGKYGATWPEFKKQRDFKPVAKFGKCFVKCMGGSLTAPIWTKLVEERGTRAAERYALKKGAKLRTIIKYGSKTVSIIGWGYFGYEAFECMKKCGKESGTEKTECK